MVILCPSLFFRESLKTPVLSAPTARNVIAQGNALGEVPSIKEALKARNNQIDRKEL